MFENTPPPTPLAPTSQESPPSPSQPVTSKLKFNLPPILKRIASLTFSSRYTPIFTFILGLALGAIVVNISFLQFFKAANPNRTYPYYNLPTDQKIIVPTPPPGIYRLGGLDMTINDAIRLQRTDYETDLLILRVTIAANIPCPQVGTCYATYGMYELTNPQGYIQELAKPANINARDIEFKILEGKSLYQGTKYDGDVAFEIDKTSSEYHLRWHVTSSNIEDVTGIVIKPPIYDPYQDWLDFSHQEFPFSFRYPQTVTPEIVSTTNPVAVSFMTESGFATISAESTDIPISQRLQNYHQNDMFNFGSFTWKIYYQQLDSTTQIYPTIFLVDEKENTRFMIEYPYSQLPKTLSSILNTLVAQP
jgi:hypothetical protein